MGEVDVTYDLIDYLEREKKWMMAVAVSCLILAPLALYINLIALRFLIFRTVIHRFFDFKTILIVLNVIISGILVFVGVKQALFLSKWNKKLEMIREHEKTVFEEVVGKG